MTCGQLFSISSNFSNFLAIQTYIDYSPAGGVKLRAANASSII